MIPINGATQSLLESNTAVLRDLLWIGARLRSTGATASRGWWNDAGNVSLQVIDAQNVVRNRVYIGGGDLIDIGPIPRALGLVAQSVSIKLSAISTAAEEAIREWDPQRAEVEIHRAILDPDSMTQTQPAIRRYVGFIDETNIQTAMEGGDSYIDLQAASLSQELQRSNSAKRSDADQRRRDPNDSFFLHAAVIGRRLVQWGDKDRK